MSDRRKLRKAKELIKNNEIIAASKILDEIVTPGTINFLDAFNPVKKETVRWQKYCAETRHRYLRMYGLDYEKKLIKEETNTEENRQKLEYPSDKAKNNNGFIKETKEQKSKPESKPESKTVSKELAIKYKERIDSLFLTYRDDPEVSNIMKNFMKFVPTKIFEHREFFGMFESYFSRVNKIAYLLFWSTNAERKKLEKFWCDVEKYNGKFSTSNFMGKLMEVFEGSTSGIYRYIDDFDEIYRIGKINKKGKIDEIGKIENFITDKIEKLKKVLSTIIQTENESDLNFLILRFIQFSFMYGLELTEEPSVLEALGDFESLTFEECLFRYFQGFGFPNKMFDFSIPALTFILLKNNKFSDTYQIDDFNFLKRCRELEKILSERKEDFEFKLFKFDVVKPVTKISDGFSIHDVDLMTGYEFEVLVSKIFKKLGYNTIVTKASGDFGVDVIAEKDGYKVGIQAKCYSSPVSNSAVQQVVAGMKYYKCQRGLVVTNQIFTSAAIELAKVNSIQLWDRSTLKEKIEDLIF